MSRSIEPGDKVVIEFEDRTQEYTIDEIYDTHIALNSLSGEPKTLYQNEFGDWRISQLDEPHQVRFEAVEEVEDEEFLYYISDPNLLIDILSDLDDVELTRLCQTSSYINEICQSEDLWRLKINKAFDYYPDETVDYKSLYMDILNTPIETDNIIRAALDGNINLLKWMYYREPDRVINANLEFSATSEGHLDILKWLNQINPKISQNSKLANTVANIAAEKGHLHILEWLADQENPMYPGFWGYNMATVNGNLDVLKWLAIHDPIFMLNTHTASVAASSCWLNILEWLASFDPPILSDSAGANNALISGCTDVLKWMLNYESDSKSLPTTLGFNEAIKKGNVEALKLLHDWGPLFIPTVDNANQAAEYGQLETLKWMASLNPPVYPDVRGATSAYKRNEFTVLNWLASLNPPILPIKRTNRW